MRTGNRDRLRAARAGLAALLAVVGAGCGPELDVGSDVVWSARFEGQSFDEYTDADGGGAPSAYPAPAAVAVSNERAHRGSFAAKLTIDTAQDTQQNIGLARSGVLPMQAYYSAWYYLPRTIEVGTFWVIFKLRMRTVVDDDSTSAELYDLNLANLPSGEMTLRLYDHRSGNISLDAIDPVVPVGVWFQVEAFYRNAPDTTGRLTLWLDGRQILDIQNQPMAPTPWIAWDAGSVGMNLTPSMAVLYIDDCAISHTRVGPTGIIAR